ncbi:hypothetical protein EC988_006405 [Linderina pennispora]|nr:hypothetical protein EC988_006405 [Linderina pennispora]
MRLIDFAQVKAFLNLAVDTDEGAGARSIIFGAGLGGMRPNIVVMGFLKLNQQWPSNRQSDTGAIDDVLLPTDGIKLNTPIEPQAYLRIIEDVLLMGKAIGIAYGFSKLGLTMPDAHSLVSPQSWWFGPRKHAHTSPHKTRYIDLWPIQIGTATAVSRSSDHSTYLTNFDSYVMVLQLGTVLHLVPYWNRNYKLRVMCFVENEADVEEETRRVAKLLRDLRVEAELCVHFLRNAGIESYDSAVLESPMVARDASASSVPPNARMVQSERPVQGVTFASPVQPPQEHVAESPQLGFSMRVNLPMPMRYESGRLGADSSSSESDSDFLSDCEPATGLRTPLQTDDDDGPVRALARYATISEGDRRSPASVSRRQQLLSRATRRIRGGWPADRQPGVDAPPVNIPTADHNVQLQARRRSDGSAVLTDFYTRALAALNSNPQQQPPVAPVSMSPALPPHPAQQQQTEFNDMPTLTQNRILNELIRRESEPSTALIFTTLQAPELGASQNAQKTMDYLTEIDTLAHDLPPVFLVHATSLTVTTSL